LTFLLTFNENVSVRFQLKDEPGQGSGDDTALDMIKLMCNNGTSVIYGKPENLCYATYDSFGNWMQTFKCAQFYTGAKFR
jgi:hypothetical protein